MRKLRNTSGLSQQAIADRMKISGAYVSDLEQGYRNWSNDLIARFKAACAKKP